MRRVITNIGTLVTLAPLVKQQRFTNIRNEDLGILENSWLAIESGHVMASGSGPLPAEYSTWESLSAHGGLVIPGLVDCHTHPCYGGDRAHEFAQRLGGATYQEIARAGGGIQYTVRQTRTLSVEQLASTTLRRLQTFMQCGVTTVEAKSGYGLSVADELKMLRAIKAAAAATPQEVKATCLALHALPPEFSSVAEYVRHMTKELLPIVKEEKLATAVDAFVEKGYFEVEDCESYIRKAQELGFDIRIHADEFADGGAGAAAAKWGALSADHLEWTSLDSAMAMAKAGTVAVFLPGTSLYTKIPYTHSTHFRTAGCPIALATDYNPGSCQISNLPFIATLGALHCGLSAAEALAAVTLIPSYSMRLHHRKGALTNGFDADLNIYRDLSSLDQWIADLGQSKPDIVMISGKKVAGNSL